jgi:hypothetical protein
MPIDVKRYLEKKEKGLVKLSKIGRAAVASWDTFDQETGKLLDPVVESLDLKNLEEVRKQAADLLAGIDAMIADVEAVLATPTPTPAPVA